MRRPELDHILGTMLDSQPDVSDLLFTVDKPLQVEALGELKQYQLALKAFQQAVALDGAYVKARYTWA